MAKKAQLIVENLTAEAERGKSYLGKVQRLEDYGAFVEILPGQSGLLHVSEIAPFRVRDVRDFLSEGQEIQVRVIEIADNGTGILPEVQPYIFEPFFTTKEVGKGTGLGLNTSYKIVKRHGGDIRVTSQLGDTCFQVQLPVNYREDIYPD